MAKRITESRRQLNEQIKLLSQLVRADKRDERAAAKVAGATKPKLAPHLTRTLARAKGFITKVQNAEESVRTDPNGWDTCTARASLPGHRMILACLIRDYPNLLAGTVERAGLQGWSERYLTEIANARAQTYERSKNN